MFTWKQNFLAKMLVVIHTKSFHPICGRKISLQNKCVNNVVNGAKDAFQFTILLGCIWARKTHVNTNRVTKSMKLGILEFFNIVTLKGLDIGLKLIFDEYTKVKKF